MIDLDELERLAKAATQGRWTITLKPDPNYPGVQIYDLCTGGHFSGQLDTHFPGDPEAHYIPAACNAVPDLIAENRALQERVRYLEEQNKELSGWNYEFQREARKLQFQLEQAAKEAE